MEVRLLQDEELANAAGLSRFVFDNCLRMRMDFPQTITFVEEYLKEHHLREMKNEGKLLLWGVFENGQMVGVSGMQSDGLITMLYVLPQCFKRGYGSKLLQEMRIYAKDTMKLEKVTVNATPAFTSYYFKNQGFFPLAQNISVYVPFVSMFAKSSDMEILQKKHLSNNMILGAVLGCLGFATLMCLGYIVYFLLT